MLFYMLLLATG